MCGMINPQTMTSPKICLVAVEGLLQIFERCENDAQLQSSLGELQAKCSELGLVENLWRIVNEIPQNDKTDDLHMKTHAILNKYFGDNDEGAAQVDVDQGFGAGIGAQSGGFNFGS